MATFPTMPAGTVVALRYKGDSLGAVGSSIAAWPEIDGKGDATQATTSQQPVVADGPNGHKAADFGGDDVLQLPSAVLTALDGKEEWAWFSVLVPQDSATDTMYILFLSHGGTATSTRAGLKTSATDYIPAVAYRRNDGDALAQAAGTANMALNTAVGITGHVAYGTVGAAKVYQDGTEIGTAAAELGAIDATTSLGGSLGGRTTSNSDYWKGLLVEGLLVVGPVTADTRSKVHSYFQDEYGVTFADYVATTQAESGGSATTVSTTAPGGGTASEAASGGSSASVNTTTSGAGTASETVEGGSASTVAVAASGGGTASDPSAGGSEASVTVAATGGGVATIHPDEPVPGSGLSTAAPITRQVFIPPTASRPMSGQRLADHPGHSLFRHYYNPVGAGVNVWLMPGGALTTNDPGDGSEVRVFHGGHLNTVDDSEAAILRAAGYTVVEVTS